MSTLKSVQTFVSNNSSKILAVIGTAGLLATTVLAVKETPKALRLIEAKKEELGKEKLTVKETVQATWKCYILPFSVCVTSLGCIVGSNVSYIRKISNLSAAYTLSEDIFREYRNKVIETIGEEKEKEIKEEVEKETVNRMADIPGNLQLASFGDYPCLDKYSKEVFWSTKEKIGAVINKLNFKMLNENYISLNDYCFEFGIEIDEDYGDKFGWNVNWGYLEPRFSATELNNQFVNGRPVLLVELNVKPDRGYSDMH